MVTTPPFIPQRYITTQEIAGFFSTEAFVDMHEFMIFWTSLGEDEKDYYRNQVRDMIYKVGDYAT